MKNVKDNRYTQEILSEILDSKWFGNYYSPYEYTPEEVEDLENEGGFENF